MTFPNFFLPYSVFHTYKPRRRHPFPAFLAGFEVAVDGSVGCYDAHKFKLMTYSGWNWQFIWDLFSLL
jgi:hypothetical protein